MSKEQSIADWIINYLEKNKSENDEILHWNACNHFLSRNAILYSSKELEKFSEKYDNVLRYLRNEFYIGFKGSDIWINGSRKKENTFKVSTKEHFTKIEIKCLYVIEFETGVKFGISGKFKSRLNYYKQPWCLPIISCYIMQCDNPEEIEAHLKNCFKQYTVGKSKEFVSVSSSKIMNEIMAFYPQGVFEHFIH